ncbi:MAG: Soluble quinoprotein glucose/sorbosone dehydrogenase, partial [Frankiales bacterium]|nr:Soluble quinoprotein glucose/sorbosone dehydrogenase [Frankiales bacterium]
MRIPAGLIGAVLLLAGCTTAAGSGPAPTAGPAATGAPRLQVQVVADGLDHPWDVAQAPDGTLLVDQRAGGLIAARPAGVHRVAADFDDLFATGETGLEGLVLDPAFATSRRFYTCQGVRDGAADGGPDMEVVAWTMAADWSAATRVADPLLGDIPVNRSSGRHGGCRLRFDPAGALLVSTGDNAVGSNPQDRSSLAGKVLRIDAATGRPATGNPFSGGNAAYVWTYGHRNVQGLAVRPGTTDVYAVEQGTSRDDEVNLLRAGGNYGYDPDGAGGSYDESVPMTDLSLPGAVAAVWSSGETTIATSGGTFLSGRRWRGYDGLMLLGVLKGQGVLALR